MLRAVKDRKLWSATIAHIPKGCFAPRVKNYKENNTLVGSFDSVDLFPASAQKVRHGFGEKKV